MSNNIEEQIEKERENARTVCSTEGGATGECAAAWDVVEELQAEAAHQRQAHPKQTTLEQYCSDNPDAVECRIYDD